MNTPIGVASIERLGEAYKSIDSFAHMDPKTSAGFVLPSDMKPRSDSSRIWRCFHKRPTYEAQFALRESSDAFQKRISLLVSSGFVDAKLKTTIEAAIKAFNTCVANTNNKLSKKVDASINLAKIQWNPHEGTGAGALTSLVEAKDVLSRLAAVKSTKDMIISKELVPQVVQPKNVNKPTYLKTLDPQGSAEAVAKHVRTLVNCGFYDSSIKTTIEQGVRSFNDLIIRTDIEQTACARMTGQVDKLAEKLQLGKGLVITVEKLRSDQDSATVLKINQLNFSKPTSVARPPVEKKEEKKVETKEEKTVAPAGQKSAAATTAAPQKPVVATNVKK